MVGTAPSFIKVDTNTPSCHEAERFACIFSFNFWKLVKTLIVSCSHIVVIDFEVALKNVTNLLVNALAYKLTCADFIRTDN